MPARSETPRSGGDSISDSDSEDAGSLPDGSQGFLPRLQKTAWGWERERTDSLCFFLGSHTDTHTELHPLSAIKPNQNP